MMIMTTTTDILDRTTVRPGDVIRTEDGRYQTVGELFDTNVEILEIFKYGPATLKSYRRMSYDQVEQLKVASGIPYGHPAKTLDYRAVVRHDHMVALQHGVC